jgi:hypothetical protein
MVESRRALVNEKGRGTRWFFGKKVMSLAKPNHSHGLALQERAAHFALSAFASLTFRVPFRK